MFVNPRKIRIRPLAAVVHDSLSKSERIQVQKTLDLLEYPVSQRPRRLGVFRSKIEPGRYIVKVNSSLRLVYHRKSPREVVVDDIYRKGAVASLLKRKVGK